MLCFAHDLINEGPNHSSRYDLRASVQPERLDGLERARDPERPEHEREDRADEVVDDLDVQVLAPDDLREARQDDEDPRHGVGDPDRGVEGHAEEVLQHSEAGEGADQSLLPCGADASELEWTLLTNLWYFFEYVACKFEVRYFERRQIPLLIH